MTTDWLIWDTVRAEADYRAEEMHKAARFERTAPTRRNRRNKGNTLITRSRRTRRAEASRRVEEPRLRGGEQEEAGQQHSDRA